MTRKTKADIAERGRAIARLLDLCPPGTKVYTILRHVSSSGMMRVIDAFVFYTDEFTGEARPFWLSGLISTACDIKRDPRRDGLRVGGCGMDTGFHVVYELSRTLYRDGYGCIGEKCQSNDHYNGDRDYTPHASDAERVGADGEMCSCHKWHWHSDGGYALRHEWL